MASELKLITQVDSWKTEVQIDVVERLKLLLELAKSGEMQGFAYSAFNVDGTVSTGFTKNNNQSAIIGGLARVQFRMLSGED